VKTLIAHSPRNTSTENARSQKNSATSEADEATMSTGMRNVENQMSEMLTPPRRPARPRRSQMRRKRPVTCTLPRPQRSRCFHSDAMSRGSSAHTIACGSNTTRLPQSWMLIVVTVSSASVDVSISPPIASRLSRRTSCAPPARHACAPSTFCARRAPACALTYS
jgi:hypothetical protein